MSRASRGTASVADIDDHLIAADPSLGRLISAVVARIGPQRISPSNTSPFEALVRAVVYQSVSGAAAAAIFNRLKSAIGPTVSPARVAAMRREVFLEAGPSKAKMGAILGLADWFTANRKLARTLRDSSDEDLISTLTTIAGIGLWTVKAFLIFKLGRLDVMPTNALGIPRGVQLVYRLREVATPRQVHETAQAWRPYRTIASIYLWKALQLTIGLGELIATVSLPRKRGRDRLARQLPKQIQPSHTRTD